MLLDGAPLDQDAGRDQLLEQPDHAAEAIAKNSQLRDRGGGLLSRALEYSRLAPLKLRGRQGERLLEDWEIVKAVVPARHLERGLQALDLVLHQGHLEGPVQQRGVAWLQRSCRLHHGFKLARQRAVSASNAAAIAGACVR